MMRQSRRSGYVGINVLDTVVRAEDVDDLVFVELLETVEYDGEARDLLFDLSEDVEAEGGRYEDTVSIALALLGCELVSTVRRTDGDSQRVNTRLADEVDYFFWLGVGVVLSYDIIFDTSEDTEFTFDRDVELVSVLNDRTRQSNVLVVRKVRTVDHH